MTDRTEHDIAKLITSLPPAPPAWVKAAQELPRARAAIDTLTARAQASVDERDAMLRDLEAALQGEGIEPRRELIRELRGRLNDTST
jgi:hypothetical protein